MESVTSAISGCKSSVSDIGKKSRMRIQMSATASAHNVKRFAGPPDCRLEAHVVRAAKETASQQRLSKDSTNQLPQVSLSVRRLNIVICFDRWC